MNNMGIFRKIIQALGGNTTFKCDIPIVDRKEDCLTRDEERSWLLYMLNKEISPKDFFNENELSVINGLLHNPDILGFYRDNSINEVCLDHNLGYPHQLDSLQPWLSTRLTKKCSEYQKLVDEWYERNKF